MMTNETIVKNFKAINQKFKDDEGKRSKQDERIRHLEEQLAQLIRENQELKQKINIIFGKVMGSGATT